MQNDIHQEIATGVRLAFIHDASTERFIRNGPVSMEALSGIFQSSQKRCCRTLECGHREQRRLQMTGRCLQLGELRQALART